MKSKLQFLNYQSNTSSNCGEVLEIAVSNHDLDWKGVLVEKGYSPHFYPQNVYTPYFYFALATEQDLHWKAQSSEGMITLKTTPGDIWINPPKTPFSHEISEPCYFVILAVEEETFFNETKITLEPKELQFLNNYNVVDDVLKGIIDLFLMEAQTRGKNGYAYLQNLLALLTTHYINSYSNYSDLKKERRSTSKFGQREMSIVDHYIAENLQNNIAIEGLSEQLNCSKFYFLREFKKLNSITPYQYILAKKLDEAQRLLTMNHETITSVAFDLGFNDQSHFTRAFKNHFGLTPGQFQKQASS